MHARRLPAPSISRMLRDVSRRAGRFHAASMFQATTWAMLAFMVLFPFALSVSTAQSQPVIPPATRVGDVAVGGMSVGEARDVVTNRVAVLAGQPASVMVNGQEWTPIPSELGISYDVETSIEPASSGLDGNAAGRNLPLAIPFDPSVFNAYLDSVLHELGGEAVDATVVLDGVDIVVTPSTKGLDIDRDAVEATLLEQVSSLQPVSLIADATRQEARISTAAAEDARERIESVLSESFVLRLDDQSWSLSPEEVAPALRFVPTADGSLQLSWDAAALETVIDPIAAEIDSDVVDSWVQDLGTKSWLVPAKEARSLDHSRFFVSMQEALTDGSHTIELAVQVHDSPDVPTEEKMAELGITDVLGTGDSLYAGSGPGRSTNVEVAAYMVDGTLVAPGEIFSFNAAVGSLFNGMYMDAGSYLDGPNGQSLGGGVCQVSTTVFRAALEAGFPIVEWWPHTYRSVFYELGGWSPGFDAAIVQDSLNPEESTDLKFQNTTDSWLMISAEVSVDGGLNVEILGADPGYAVSFEEPVVEVLEYATSDVSTVADEQLPPGTVDEQPAMDGLRVTVVRNVWDADGTLVSEDTFVSSYGSYGAIRRVSPDMLEVASGQ